jgi:hypothetical protein
VFEKLSSYNLVTNLVPGAVLAVALRYAGLPLVDPEKVGTFLVLAYALGAVSSRLGSLILDPALHRSKILPSRDYKAFVEVSATDPKMDVLVETANGYRTFTSAGVLFFGMVGAFKAANGLGLSQTEMLMAAAAAITLVFGLSYKKQDSYVSARVARHSSTA